MEKKIEEKSAYTTIKSWIFQHRLKPGDKLTERMVAEKLELSRIPVREAFQHLSIEGFIENIPGRGQCLKVYNE